MMNQLPMRTIYKSVVQLFVDSYADVFPFLFMLAIIQYSTDFFFNPIGTHQFLNAIIQMIAEMLFSCFVLSALYQRRHQDKISYSEVFSQGLLKVIPMIGASIILLFPIIVFMLVAFALLFMLNMPLSTMYSALTIVAIIGLLYFFIVFTYCYVVGVLIVCEGEGPWNGIKKSWKMVRGHWLKTFLLLLSLSVIIGIVNWILIKTVGKLYAKEFITLLLFSLGPVLMVVLCEQLENISEKTPTQTPSSIPKSPSRITELTE